MPIPNAKFYKIKDLSDGEIERALNKPTLFYAEEYQPTRFLSLSIAEGIRVGSITKVLVTENRIVKELKRGDEVEFRDIRYRVESIEESEHPESRIRRLYYISLS